MLELRHVSASYGRFRALFDVSFSVAKGSVAAMLGPNGAGKSTIARVVAGLVPTTAGTVMLAGQDVTGLSVGKIVHHGLAFAPEGRPVFATLDVEDNLRLTFCRQLPRREVAAALARTYGRFPHLKDRRRQLAGTLSGGEQRLLALARVLAVPPLLLVVDELSLGLAPKAVDDVFAALRDINQAGTTLLVVEQQVPRALELADRVIVLRKGRVTHDVAVAEMPADLTAELLPVTP
jgi:branched-chain amino acid transport system ATP-binding protein